MQERRKGDVEEGGRKERGGRGRKGGVGEGGGDGGSGDSNKRVQLKPMGEESSQEEFGKLVMKPGRSWRRRPGRGASRRGTSPNLKNILEPQRTLQNHMRWEKNQNTLRIVKPT